MKKLLGLLIIGLSLAYILRTHVVEWIYIASGSMEPTLHVNTRLFVNKLVYKTGRPKRGEIIAFKSPADDKKLVKRVIAIEGDRVEMVDKAVWLNGKKIEELYVQHTREGEKFLDDNFLSQIVPEGSVFVLGDNRDESNDSRNWIDPKTNEPMPFIKLEDVEGRIFGFY